MLATAVLHVESVVPMIARWLKAIGCQTSAAGSIRRHPVSKERHQNAVHAVVFAGTDEQSLTTGPNRKAAVSAWSTSPPRDST